MKVCFLGLGSNLGEREQLLRQAVKLLAGLPETRVLETSSIYETEPWGLPEQPAFLNAVVKLGTALSPENLLAACQNIENMLMRTRSIKWGPRSIDIDILLYEDVQVSGSRLSIPHPLLQERLFVLIPLAEISPGLILDGHTIEQRISGLSQTGVRYYKPWIA